MANVQPPARVSETLASVLRSGRGEFNAQFAEARRLYPELNGAEFLEFLRREVDPLITALEHSRPEQIAEMVMAAYETGLELLGQKLVGSGARHRCIEAGWHRVLVPLASLVAQAPGRVLGGISNALHYLAVTSGARPEQWIMEMERLGPQCGSVESLLGLGQVLAWRSGLAHFRQGALVAADQLPAALALAAVGAPTSSCWPEIRKRLLANHWFDPATPPSMEDERPGRLRVVAQAGAFRGFGGVFSEPPRVASDGEHFLVSSGQESWLLTADLFGATFHRTSQADFDAAVRGRTVPPGLEVAESGVVWRKERLEVPGLGKVTSAASNGTTLALTSAWTHAIILLAVS